MRDRNLSGKEVSVYGFLLLTGSLALGSLVSMQLIAASRVGDTSSSLVLMILAFIGCVWSFGKGVLLLRSKEPAANIMSTPTLYAMSAGMLALAVLCCALAASEQAWGYFLPLIVLFVGFTIATFFRARSRQRGRA